MSAEPRHLSALDTFYLDTETDTTPMHFACLFTVKADHFLDSRGRVRSRAIRDHVASRWQDVTIAHLQLRGGEHATVPYVWERRDDLDMALHIPTVRLKNRANDRDLMKRCAEILRSPLPRTEPLWRLHLLTGLTRDRIGFLLQIHHSLTDGLGGSILLRALMDEDLNAASQSHPGINTQPTGTPSAVSVARAAVHNVLHIAEGAAYLAASTRIRPSTSLNAPVTTARHLDTASTALADVGAIARTLGATINDVALSAVAGALGAILGVRGDPIATMTLEALVPVSTRRAGGSLGVGNHTSVMQVPLPIGIGDPVHRTRVISAATAKRKTFHSVETVLSAEALVSDLHVPLQKGLTRLFSDHQSLVNVVVTNLPGPEGPMHFMGATVGSITPFLPLAHDLPLAVAFGSYNGTLTIGVQSDPTLCPDATAFIRRITQEIHTMTASLNDSRCGSA